MNELKKTLGFWSCFAVGVGLVVASSTLVTLGQGMGMAGAGFIFAMLAAWFLQLFSAQSFAELSCSIPKSGSLSAYARIAIGPLVGMVSLLTGYILMSMATVPAELAVAGAVFNGVFAPFFSPSLFALILLVILTIPNILGVDMFAKLQMVLTSIMIISMSVLGIIGLLGIGNPVPDIPSGSFNPMGWGVLGLTALAIWLYIGIEFVTPFVEEIKSPEKNIPRSMVMGLVVIIGVNLLYGFASIRYMPLDALAESDSPHVLVAEAILGKAGMIWIGIVSIAATASSVNTFIGVIPRMLYGMAQAGEMPSIFAKIHPKFRTPWIGIIFTSAVYALLLLVGIAGIEQILILIMSACACWLLAYVLAHVVVIIMRKKYPTLKRPYKTPLYPLPQIIGSVGMLYAIWQIYPEPITKMTIYTYAAVMILVAVAFSAIWLKFVKKVPLFKPVSLAEEMGEEFAKELLGN